MIPGWDRAIRERGRLNGLGALKLVGGEVLRAAFDGDVARGVQDAGQRHELGEMLSVVPGVELLVILVVDEVGVDQEDRPAFLRHCYPSSGVSALGPLCPTIVPGMIAGQVTWRRGSPTPSKEPSPPSPFSLCAGEGE